MEECIEKFSNTLMHVQITHLHMNSYFMSKFYFGCGIMDVTGPQDKELRRIHETPLARKLGLGSKFPRKMLCGRVTAMDVGIVALKSVI